MAMRANEIMMLKVVESANEAIYDMKGYEVNAFVLLFPL